MAFGRMRWLNCSTYPCTVSHVMAPVLAPMVQLSTPAIVICLSVVGVEKGGTCATPATGPMQGGASAFKCPASYGASSS